jgi:hypothetical protein
MEASSFYQPTKAPGHVCVWETVPIHGCLRLGEQGLIMPCVLFLILILILI